VAVLVRRDRVARAVLAAVLLCITGLIVALVLTYQDWEPQPIIRIEASSTGTAVELTVAHGRCSDEELRPEVSEQSDANVTVRVEQDVSGDCEDIGLRSTYTVELDEPLGSRTITGDPWIGQCIIDGADSDRCRTTGAPG
jgi:hypothetical protein